MARPSTVDRLPKGLKLQVDLAIKDGLTIDEIVALVREAGGDVSRSAMGRYRGRYADLIERERDMKAVAESFAHDFGGSNNPAGKLVIQLVTSMAARAAMQAGEDDAEIDGQELHFFARAAKDLASAAKTDTDRDIVVEKRTKEKAAKDAEAAGREAGATEATIALIKARILGVDE